MAGIPWGDPGAHVVPNKINPGLVSWHRIGYRRVRNSVDWGEETLVGRACCVETTVASSGLMRLPPSTVWCKRVACRIGTSPNDVKAPANCSTPRLLIKKGRGRM